MEHRADEGELPGDNPSSANPPAVVPEDKTLLLRALLVWFGLWVTVACILLVVACFVPVPGSVIVVALIGAFVTVFGSFVTISQQQLRKLLASPNAAPLKTLVVVLVVVVVASGVLAIEYWTRREIVPAPQASTGGSTTTTSPAGGSDDGPCTSPGQSDWKMPPVQMCVMHWCKGIVVFPNGAVDVSRFQVKVRPHIVNNSTGPLDITIWKPAAVRLLVRESAMRDSWRPPPKTAGFGDLPYLVTAPNGQEFWAVAPDIPKDVDEPVDRSKPSEIGFASFWKKSSIAQDEAYPPAHQGRDPAGGPDQDGDLVFQLPKTADTDFVDGAEPGFYALVLVDRSQPTKILATAWRKDWGPRLDPTAF